MTVQLLSQNCGEEMAGTLRVTTLVVTISFFCYAQTRYDDFTSFIQN